MASSKKTANLGLNNWTDSDSPKRSDFVTDNQIIDNFLGNHINDTSLHLTASEKDRVSSPFDIITYYGTGEASLTIDYIYTPVLAIVCKKNSPLQTLKNSNYSVNSGFAFVGGTTGGLRISSKKITVEQSSEATNGVLYNLNESGSEYMLITFK